jgi:1,4-dihydroxy-2-naphthoate octaprenyltransferase
MPSAKPTRPHPVQIWLRAVRAPLLIATMIPVLLGGGFALMDRSFDGWTFLAAMIAVLLLQAGTHLFNDYFDFSKGADCDTSLTPPSVIRLGWLMPQSVYRGGLFCFLSAALVGSYLVYTGGVTVLLLGIVGLVVGYWFTGTRWALSYHALGELAVFLLHGPLLVYGTYYVMVGITYSHVLLGGIPIGLLWAAMLHLNNMRDLEHDRKIGKHTLATLFGPAQAKTVYYFLLLPAYLIPLALYLTGMTPGLALLALLTFPLALYNMWVVHRTSDPVELNVAYGLTVLLQLLFGILHVFGVFLYNFTTT